MSKPFDWRDVSMPGDVAIPRPPLDVAIDIASGDDLDEVGATPELNRPRVPGEADGAYRVRLMRALQSRAPVESPTLAVAKELRDLAHAALRADEGDARISTTKLFTLANKLESK